MQDNTYQAYKTISQYYKVKFFNFFLSQFLNLCNCSYNIDHDDYIYKIANFGAKVRPTYISFVFGVKEQDINILINMLQAYQIFDVKQLQSNIVQILFLLSDQNVYKLKHRRSITKSQKRLKQMVINCYRRIKQQQSKQEN